MRWKPKMVLLHLKDAAPSLQGVLTDRPGIFYRVEAGQIVTEDGAVALDGVTWVPAANVLFYQEVSA